MNGITITVGLGHTYQPGDRIVFHSAWPTTRQLQILSKPRRKRNRLKVARLTSSYRIAAVQSSTLSA